MIRGTLLVVPVLHSVLYVEPLYLAAEGGLPQFKRVIVAYSDHVVMEPTLEDALNAIFKGSTNTPAETAVAAATGFRRRRKRFHLRLRISSSKRTSISIAHSRTYARVIGAATARRSSNSAQILKQMPAKH